MLRPTVDGSQKAVIGALTDHEVIPKANEGLVMLGRSSQSTYGRRRAEGTLGADDRPSYGVIWALVLIFMKGMLYYIRCMILLM